MGGKPLSTYSYSQSSFNAFTNNKDPPEYLESPYYNLERAEELPESVQKQITWLLVQFKPKGEPLTEQVDGYLKILKKNRYCFKEIRWLLFTTNSLYLVEPNNFMQLNLRIPIISIESLGYSLDNKSFGIKSENEASFYVFYSENSINAVNAIKTLFYLLKEDFINVLIAESTKAFKYLMNKKIEAEGPDFETFAKIKESFEIKGEYLITSVIVFEAKPKIRKRKLFLSNFSIYLTSFDGEVYKTIEVAKVCELVLLSNHLEFGIRGVEGDFWLVYNQAYALLSEVSEIIKEEYGKDIRIQIKNPHDFSFY